LFNEEDNLQCQENKRLTRQLEVAAAARWRIRRALRLIVVLSREDECGEPEIGEDEVGKGVVALVKFEERSGKRGDPEGEGKSGLTGVSGVIIRAKPRGGDGGIVRLEQ
jgi:hypothetical protein